MKFFRRWMQEMKDSPAMDIVIDVNLIMFFTFLTMLFYGVSPIGFAFTVFMCVFGIFSLMMDVSKYNEKYNKNKE